MHFKFNAFTVFMSKKRIAGLISLALFTFFLGRNCGKIQENVIVDNMDIAARVETIKSHNQFGELSYYVLEEYKKHPGNYKKDILAITEIGVRQYPYESSKLAAREASGVIVDVLDNVLDAIDRGGSN